MKETWIMSMTYKKTVHKPEVWGRRQLQAKACQIGGEVWQQEQYWVYLGNGIKWAYQHD